jgi:hypothetical protein
MIHQERLAALERKVQAVDLDRLESRIARLEDLSLISGVGRGFSRNGPREEFDEPEIELTGPCQLTIIATDISNDLLPGLQVTISYGGSSTSGTTNTSGALVKWVPSGVPLKITGIMPGYLPASNTLTISSGATTASRTVKYTAGMSIVVTTRMCAENVVGATVSLVVVHAGGVEDPVATLTSGADGKATFDVTGHRELWNPGGIGRPFAYIYKAYVSASGANSTVISSILASSPSTTSVPVTATVTPSDSEEACKFSAACPGVQEIPASADMSAAGAGYTGPMSRVSGTKSFERGTMTRLGVTVKYRLEVDASGFYSKLNVYRASDGAFLVGFSPSSVNCTNNSATFNDPAVSGLITVDFT